jgi:hypothetical protein
MSTPDPSARASDLPSWAQQALKEAPASGTRASGPALGHAEDGTVWPLLVDAALTSTFLPRELAPGVGEGSARASAEATVLQWAEAAYTPKGAEWELRRDARADILRHAWNTDALNAALARTSRRFDDPVSHALRDIVEGRVEAPSGSTNLRRLEALHVAGSTLSGLEALERATPLSTLDRLIRQRRLIEQFERICGRDFRTDVVGREQELERLNAFVGVVGATTLKDQLSRGVGRIRRAISGRQPLAIWGTGGVGKTTLLSRFMLEHIDKAEKSFPLAYLDFDRPSLSPRDHFGLLAEICLQFMSQFERLDTSLQPLRERALVAQSDFLSLGAQAEPLLMDLAGSLQQTLDTFLDGQESLLEWSRPVLIVLDTFEVVQYDANQVRELENFLQIVAPASWSRLRLIVSGRKRIEAWDVGVDEMELMGIEVRGAADGANQGASSSNPDGRGAVQGRRQRNRRTASLVAVSRTAGRTGARRRCRSIPDRRHSRASHH